MVFSLLTLRWFTIVKAYNKTESIGPGITTFFVSPSEAYMNISFQSICRNQFESQIHLKMHLSFGIPSIIENNSSPWQIAYSLINSMKLKCWNSVMLKCVNIHFFFALLTVIEHEMVPKVLHCVFFISIKTLKNYVFCSVLNLFYALSNARTRK